MPMRISSKVSGLATGFAKFVSSFMSSFLHSPPGGGRGEGRECWLFGGERGWLRVGILDAVQSDVQAERPHLLDEHVEALGNASLEGVVAFDDRLVDLG